MLFICYEKCSTCKKAEKWLIDNQIEFEKRDIKTKNPTIKELKKWQKLSSKDLQKFFNTSGMLYRSMELSKKTKMMSDEEKLALLASDGMLVKRPLLIGADFVLVGFRENEWKERLTN